MSEVLLAAARDRGAGHIASTLGRVLDIAQGELRSASATTVIATRFPPGCKIRVRRS